MGDLVVTGPRAFLLPAQTTLDGSGNGTATVSCPGSADWVVTEVSVTVATATKQPTAQLYLNGTGQPNFLEGTYNGSRDSTNTRRVLQPGDVLYVVWAGGDAGAKATVRVTGIAVPPGKGPQYLAGGV